MEWNVTLPLAEGAANLVGTFYLIRGRLAIARQDRPRHILNMKCAILTGVAFLVVFTLRQALVPARTVPDPDWLRMGYLGLMIIHVPAATILPFVAVPTIWLAVRGRFERHKPWARILWPLWLVANLTGIVSLWIAFVWGVEKG